MLSRSSTYTSAKSPPLPRARASVVWSRPSVERGDVHQPPPEGRADLRGRGLHGGDSRVGGGDVLGGALASAELHRRGAVGAAFALHVHGRARERERYDRHQDDEEADATTKSLMRPPRSRRR